MNVDAVIVGLGNPGTRYKFTRHNVGFMALDLIAQGLGLSFSSGGLGKKLEAEILKCDFAGKSVLLIKPQTFMNLSGQSINKLYQEHRHLKEAELIVLHDEVDIEFGKIRVKKGGGDAGHNGLKSIRSEIGSGDYYRIRMGVGRPPADWKIQLADYVLQPFRNDEDKVLTDLLIHSENTLESLLKGGLEAALRTSSL
ncbi:aminoacyl-tRNA hydrolase [bacterium]|nr:aminoacyl-tRNA hydrolase [bacterium]